MTVSLRPYQADAVEALRAGIRAGVRKQVLASPTGSGKTEIACHMLHSAHEKRSKSLFIVDRVVLVDQTSARLDQYGIPHGVIQAGHWRSRLYEPIQVCSAQTIEQRGIPEDVAVVFVDEAHCLRKKVSEYIESTDAIVVGLTATPLTKGMGKLYDGVVNVATMNQLIADGYLVPLKMYAAKAIDVSGMKVVAGEWSEREIAERGMAILGDIVQEWQSKTELHFGGPVKTIVFSATVEHGEELCRQFQAEGYNFQQISYKDGGDEHRREVLQEFRKPDSEIQGLVSCEIFTKGFDCLDSETEVLTPLGWRGIGQVAKGDLVYGYDRKTGGIEACECEGYGERAMNPGERMVSIKSQRFDIRTTEGHQFHIKYRHPKKNFDHHGWLTKTGAEMVSRGSAWGIPLSGFAEFPGVPLSDDELKLIAWFMTDGSLYKRTFEICQSKPFKDEIRGLLQRLELDFNERVVESSGYVNGKPAIRFEIPKGTHAGSLKRNGWAKYAAYLNKNVSPLLMSMTREQFRVFWTELLKGDGAKQGAKAGWLWCDRKEQADAYTQLAVLRGFSASFSTQLTKAGKPMYVVSVRDAQWIGTSTSSLAAKFRFDDPSRGERVWCVKNRLSTLIVRRHGKIAVIGNCPDVLCGISARPYRKSLSSHIQQMGRVMRASPGKSFGLWLDHSGNVLRFRDDVDEIFEHGIDELDDGKRESKSRKEPTAKERADVRCSCGYVMAAWQTKCPGCGRERRRLSMIETLPGEMVELDGNKANKTYGWDQKQQFMAGLRGYARDRGYAPGWAAHQYRAKFGVWPNDPRVHHVEAGPVTPEVTNWIKSQQIRAAKARRAA